MTDLIKSNKLPKLTGAPYSFLANLKRRGIIPKDKLLPAYWVDVVRDTYEQHMRLEQRVKQLVARYENQ